MLTVLSKVMPYSFRGRIILLIALLGILAAIANLAVSGYYEYTFLKRNMNATVTNQFQAVSKIFTEAVIYNNIYDLFTRAQAMKQFLDFVDNIYIFDANGDYLTDAKVMRDTINISGLESLQNARIFSLDVGAEKIGYVAYIINDNYIFHTMIKHLTGLAAFGLILLILGIGLGAVISSFFTKPLLKLSEQLTTTESLPLSLSIPDYAPKEVTILANTLNEISISLEDAIKTLNEQDKKIVRAEKLASIGTMAAGLAHQLKNPIMTIELLTQCIAAEGAKAEDTKILMGEAKHITKILNEFLTLSKPIHFTFTEFYADELIDKLRTFAKTNCNGLNIIAKSTFNGIIFADFQKLIDVSVNLITNSLEAGANKVYIDIYNTGQTLDIDFTDNGRGISKEIGKSIFHPFYTSKASGTGLGLAYSEMIMNAMDGEISYLGSNPGATFKLQIPLERL